MTLSESDETVVPFAYSLVGDVGMVHLVHIRDPGIPEHAARVRLAAAAARRRGPSPVQAEVHVRGGVPVDEIVRLADQLDTDALCTVRGSVAEHLVARLRRPVLVVPEPASPGRPALCGRN